MYQDNENELKISRSEFSRNSALKLQGNGSSAPPRDNRSGSHLLKLEVGPDPERTDSGEHQQAKKLPTFPYRLSFNQRDQQVGSKSAEFKKKVSGFTLPPINGKG